MKMKMKIGITGPVSSGKTTFTQKIQNILNSNSCVVHADNYYYPSDIVRDLCTDYDQPESLNVILLRDHIERLCNNEIILCAPKYSFDTHQSTYDHVIHPKEYILIEGHMIVHLLGPEFFDLIIYFDTPDDVCFERRIKRERESNTRILDLAIQHVSQTLPAQKNYVEPQKKHAHVIVNSFEMFVSMIIIMIMIMSMSQKLN
jgi:uridine kinase